MSDEELPSGFAEAQSPFPGPGLAEAERLWPRDAPRLVQRLLSSDPADGVETAQAIRAGLPIAELDALERAGYVDKEAIAAANILTPDHWARARQRGFFDPGAAQRIVRVIRVVARAKEVFGEERASIWLSRPTRPLGGRTPLSLLDTDEGARAVETLIGRIEHGIAA